MEPRTHRNAPYRFLSLVFFILPSAAILLGGQHLVHRDVALTVAGAFLSVQLAPVWEKLRKIFLSSLEAAREEGRSWQRLIRSVLSVRIVGRPRVRLSSRWSPVHSGEITISSTVEGPRQYRTMADRARIRRVERLWPHHVNVLAGRALIPGQSHSPASYPAAWYPRSWLARRRWHQRWSLWRCRCLLRFLGEILRRHDLRHELSDRDLPA